jgi:hypothetical protein
MIWDMEAKRNEKPSAIERTEEIPKEENIIKPTG